MFDRAELMFSEAIRCEATRQSYQYGLNGFLKFHNIKSQDVLILPHSEIQVMVEDYVFSMKNRGVGKSTIRSYLAGIKLFLDMSDVMVNWTKIRKFMPEASAKANELLKLLN